MAVLSNTSGGQIHAYLDAFVANGTALDTFRLKDMLASYIH